MSLQLSDIGIASVSVVARRALRCDVRAVSPATPPGCASSTTPRSSRPASAPHGDAAAYVARRRRGAGTPTWSAPSSLRDTDLPLVRGDSAAPARRSWSPAAPASVAGPVGARAAARPAAGRPRDRAARPRRPGRQRPAGGGRGRRGPRRDGATTPVYVELPHARHRPRWLRRRRRGRRGRAAAEVPHRRRWRPRRSRPPHALAALDRRGARPRDAVQVHGRAAPRRAPHRRRTGFEHHGFLNVLLATAAAFDGAAGGRRRSTMLEQRDGTRAGRRRAAGARPRRAPGAGSPRSAPARVDRAARRPGRPRAAGARGRACRQLGRGAAGSRSTSTTCRTACSRAAARRRGSASGSATRCSTWPSLAAADEPGRPRCSPSADAQRASWRSARTVWRAARRVAHRGCSPTRRERGCRAAPGPARRGDAAPAVRGRRTTSTSTPREHHATNVGRIFRPDHEPLLPELAAPARRLPRPGRHGRRVGHRRSSGRAGSGRRPATSRPDVRPVAAARHRGRARLRGRRAVRSSARRCRSTRFADHVFGVVGLNDWSARDIQAWEYVPLGPFLGKSFATSISPWVTPLAALDAALGRPARPGPGAARPTSRAGARPAGLDIDVEVVLNGEVVSRPPYRTMYWSPAQMLAHLTVNGASLRTGDLFASRHDQRPGARPARLVPRAVAGAARSRSRRRRAAAPSSRTATRSCSRYSAPGTDGGRIALGEVVGTVRPATC